MFDFLKSAGKNKELEAVLAKLEMNASNNYKDAAQLNLAEFEELLENFKCSGKLSEKQREHYEEELRVYRERMKRFTHKDQKPTWV